MEAGTQGAPSSCGGRGTKRDGTGLLVRFQTAEAAARLAMRADRGRDDEQKSSLTSPAQPRPVSETEPERVPDCAEGSASVGAEVECSQHEPWRPGWKVQAAHNGVDRHATQQEAEVLAPPKRAISWPTPIFTR